MGRTRICLLLLLSTYTLAQQDTGSVDEQYPTCFVAKTFRNFRRFVYDYEAESFNGVPGATDNKSGPKISCQVELEVPQTCSFVVRTTECSLSEIFAVDDNGKALYRPAAGAQAFKAAMAKNPLKVKVELHSNVELYPEEDEPVNILNIKRGIVTSLFVPILKEETKNTQTETTTVYGFCPTDFTVNARTDIATDVTISRDLSKCDSFNAHKQATSPLALISGMNYPLSKMISSHQTCNYKFDDQKKQMTSGTCTEKHIFLPLSYKNEYGISTLVKQTVTLRETSRINDRTFNYHEGLVRFLAMEPVDDKSPVQTKDVAINTMQQLNTLTQTKNGKQRGSLFHKLVSELRGMKADVLRSAVSEMMDISNSLTIQALVQCGTPECTSAMLKVFRTFNKFDQEVDAAVYALALLPNPSRLLVKDILAMAQNRKSKPIMYALSNAVRRLDEAEGRITPEITAVSEFMASLLGPDCSGDKDQTFLTLRVLGNIGDVMEVADPTIKNTLLKCMRQPATTLSVQLAAIQAFRRMSLTDEVRSNLQRVSQYPKGAVQKRLAAYLILMRNPQNSDIEMVKKILKMEQNEQVKSFVTSHVYNIISSTDPETQKLGRRIMDALQDIDVGTHNDYTSKSRNYKLGMTLENMHANIKGNVIFDPSNQLPREVMLESTLNIFGYNLDMWELGIEGKGSEPSIEALFGKNGFFPDTLSKALYWAENKMPVKMMEVLEKWVAPLKSEGQKVPEDLMKEIARNFNKLVKDLQNLDSPEATAYLKILGTELGFIKAADLKFIADYAKMYAEIFLKVLPTEVVSKLISGTDNELFIHYMFMDNNFFLPTASGLPLTFSLSGTFTPGAKGGLRISPNMNELVFMPSVGIEFVTKMGVHVPEFVVSGVEMHTSLYHESAVKAKLTIESNEVKLSIPAAQGPAKLIRISNTVMIVADGKASIIPHNMGDANCDSIFGFKYCTKKLQVDLRGKSDVPYFPLTGQRMFEIDIEPKVSYTATFTYALLSEGKDDPHKVDSLKMTLKADGDQNAEATATMKYNRNRNVFTSQIQIPDFDVEAGIKVGLTDSSTKDKAITLELSNKNVPQLTLTGRSRFHDLTDSMLQIQLVVPSLKTDWAMSATTSSSRHKGQHVVLEVKSDMKLPETSSIQSVTCILDSYGTEVKLMSNVNAETKLMVLYSDALLAWIRQFSEDAMDHQVVNTDMKLRHIVNKALEASNIWMNKISTELPYVETLKNNIANVEMPSMPENLFMNMESKFRYNFGNDHKIIILPDPKEWFTSPAISNVPISSIPANRVIYLLVLGMMEMSAKVDSNYYNWETTVSAGNNTVDSPNYLAKFKSQATSPIKILSYTTEGAAAIGETDDKTLKFTLTGSLEHQFVSTRVNVEETIAVSNDITSQGKYNVHVSAPLGLRTSLDITKHFTLDSAKLLGDINGDGSAAFGSLTASSTYLNTFSADRVKKELRLESTLRANSEIMKATNKIKTVYANDNLMIESNTNINSEPIKHSTKMNLNFKDAKLSILSNSVTKAGQRTLQNQIEFSASEDQASLRIGNTAEDTVNRAYSLLTGSMNPSGLELNSDASINIFSSLASHKATLALNAIGLTTSCTTTAQHNRMTFENIFHSGLDANGATMSLTTKGGIQENKVDFNVEGKIANSEVYLNGVFNGDILAINTRNTMNFRLSEDGLILSNNIVGSFNEMRTENSNSLSLTSRSLTLHTKTDNFLNPKNSYMHDITVTMEHFKASVMVKNNLKVMEINFNNDAQFKAQPYIMELTGTLKGDLSGDELKHTYEVKMMDMILSTKCNTIGKILGSQITHTTDMEVAGLTMKFNNIADYKSKSLRFDSNINAAAEPFSLNIDALFNANGGLSLYGQQGGQLYSKFLLKAEPLLFTHSFESRASTTHEIEGIPTIKTIVDNKLSSSMSLQEQSVRFKVKSKVNDHTFDQELEAYNNAERMAIEMKGAVTTSLFTEAGQDYSVSGFVKYDKNTDSHFIQIPFTEHIPAFIEEVKETVMRLSDHTIEFLKDINTQYEISNKIQNKVSELKKVIDDFDLNVFVEDLRKYVISIENVLANLTAKLPTEQIINVLQSIKDTIMAWIQNLNISNKFDAIYGKIEEILSNYEVEKVIGAVMDGVVKIMKQYHVRERIRSIFDLIRSIDIKPMIKKVMAPVEELVNVLHSFDFKQLIDDMRVYVMGMVQKIQSFDYNTFTMEVKEKVREMSKIPCFGKLYGEFKINSPHYKLRTTADLENTTATSVTPEFKLNFNSQATSTLKALQFTVDASTHLAVPKMNSLTIYEYIKIDQSSFKLNHNGTVTLYGLTGQGSADTTAKIATELYSADLVNNAFLAMEDGLSVSVNSNYKHDLNMPLFNIFTQVSSTQKTNLAVEAGSANLKMNTVANAKYAVQDFSDEATHNSDLDLVLDLHTAKVTFIGATGCKGFKTNQNVVADICVFRHAIIDAKVETETPVMKGSVLDIKFQAKAEDMQIDLTASHNARLIEGTLSSSALALIKPTELMFDTKNKGNSKLFLPFEMSGKMEFENDIFLTLNSEVQQASWSGMARVNQQKYSHYFKMDNGDTEINIISQINGEANLDFLKQPLTIPEMTVPYYGLRTPKVEGFSLWEDAALNDLFSTTQQTFDMSSKMKYMKNPEMFTIRLSTDALVSGLNTNIKIPIMGDLTYEFSMKAPMITLKSDASILNQDSFIIKLDTSSSSECEFLTGKFQGNTNVNIAGGFKMASDLALKHKMLEGNHGSNIILDYENFDASIINSVKVHLPSETMEIHQDITPNNFVFSLSTPSAGHIAVQMLTKRPAQVNARLYGRYPTEPQTDIDILALKMSVMNSEKLNIQTSWNMEMPYEVMLELKNNVPDVVQTVSTPVVMTYDQIYRYARSLEGSLEETRNQGAVLLNKAIENFAAVNPSDIITSAKDQTVITVRKYQTKFELFLDAAVKFLRETKFAIPGYAQRLSGLEVIEKCKTFIVEVYEEANQIFSEFVSSTLKVYIESFEATEFTFPGSSLTVSGREILKDSFNSLVKVFAQFDAAVRQIGGQAIEYIERDLSALLKRLRQILRSEDVKNVPALVTDFYEDAINSRSFTWIVKQIETVHHIISEYLKTVATNLQNILADISIEQLQTDIQSSTDSMLKRANAFHDNVIKVLKEKSKTVETFVRVGDRQMELDIPFPFVPQFN
ncbi:apolipoprotein B-100-like [Corythoichthys intestinalis]|uniref:apolipoprotein B-100-like n=1 Tax=Corythoichthys intestinalis TaxID=161448 RepID=UPI0025A60845|nr:apolipoprotein B-100-like [Corythoichthys intestinalis]